MNALLRFGLWLCLSSALTAQSRIQIHYAGSLELPEFNGLALNRPEGLSVSPDGVLYLADTGNHRVLKMTVHGKVLAGIGGLGWEINEFDSPAAIEAGNGLDVFVADHQNRRIVRLDKNLNFIAILEKQETWPLSFDLGTPVDVVMNAHGKLLVMDGEFHCLLLFDEEGKPEQILGDFNAGDGHLLNPSEMIVRNDRSVYVLDSATDRIHRFDAYGNYLHETALPANAAPVCLTDCGRYGIAYIDTITQTLNLINESGALCAQFNARLQPQYNFHRPVDAVCHQNTLYVLNQEAGRLDLFTIKP